MYDPATRTSYRRSQLFIAIAAAAAILVSATPFVSAGSTPASLPAGGVLPTVTLTWAPPDSNGGSMITGYRVYRGTTSGQETLLQNLGVVTSFTDTDVVTGVTYYYQVSAVNIIGEGPRSAERAATPGASTTAPSAPTLVSVTPANGSASLVWTAPLSDGGAPITSYTATTSPGGNGCTTTAATACSIGGLTNGIVYTFTVTATNSVGPSAASNALSAIPFVPPTARITGLATYRNTTTIPVAWGATLGTLPIANYDVRYRSAPWNGSFGGYATWLGATAATSQTFSGSAGRTYCFSARARDIDGNVSAWTGDTCSVIPLDDRSLSRSSYWSAGTLSVFYKSTWVRSYTSGARLTRTGVVAKGISIIATTCPTCGKVQVYWGSTLLKTISLYSSTTINKRVIGVTTFSSTRSGTLTIKVYGSRKVIIDGLAIFRN